jgi:hypothetical protein
MVKTQSEVLYFYGRDCPVCKTMVPFVDEAGMSTSIRCSS